MKLFPPMAMCLLLVGCAQSSETIQHGDVKFLLSQTQNQWADNAVLISECEKELANGVCKPKGEVRVYIMPGKMPGVVSSGVQTAGMVGSSFVIRDGLKKSKSSVSNSNTTNESISTKNVGK